MSLGKDSSDHWKDYYKKDLAPKKPSLFAEFCLPKINQDKVLLDIGCGNGRDSLYFIDKGIKAIGIDRCPVSIKQLVSIHDGAFVCEDFKNLKPMENVGSIYSRFSMHAIDKNTQDHVIAWAYKTLEKDGLFFIEARSIWDSLWGKGKKVGRNEYVTTHYRRFLVLDEVVEQLQLEGFTIEYAERSNGFAPHGDEDPQIIRIIAKK